MVITDKLEKSTLEEKIHLKVSESDEQALKRVKDRFDDMKKGRSEQEALRDYIDKTFKAKPSYKWN
jgi:selenocysteine-specific translation elongation factor